MLGVLPPIFVAETKTIYGYKFRSSFKGKESFKENVDSDNNWKITSPRMILEIYF